MVDCILNLLYERYAEGRTDENAAIAVQAIYKISRNPKGYYKSMGSGHNTVKNAKFYISELQQENSEFFRQAISSK